VKTAFSQVTPVKYTLVCRTPKVSWFLGPHDTLPCFLIYLYVYYSNVTYSELMQENWLSHLHLVICAHVTVSVCAYICSHVRGKYNGWTGLLNN